MENNFYSKETAVFRGGPMQSYWYADEHYNYHIKAFALLDEEVSAEVLKKAWDSTKQVYSVIDLIPRVFDEDIYFFDALQSLVNTDEGEGQESPNREDERIKANDPIESNAPVCPCCDATAFRAISLTFSGKCITLTAYHSLVDEFGLCKVLSVLLSAYLSERDNETAATLNLSEMYVQNTMLVSGDYTKKVIALYENSADVFFDDNISYDLTEGVMSASCIRVDKDALFGLAGSAGLCAGGQGHHDMMSEDAEKAILSVLCAVTSRTVYELFPEERRVLSLDVLADFRRTFGINNSIAPCSKHMPLIVSYDEIMGGTIEDALRSLHSLVNDHTDDDYLKTYLSFDNTYGFLKQKRIASSVAYLGDFPGSYSDNNRMPVPNLNSDHIKSAVCQVAVSDNLDRSVLMVGCGDTMWIYLQFCEQTEAYTAAMVKALEGIGISATIETPARRVPEERTIMWKS